MILPTLDELTNNYKKRLVNICPTYKGIDTLISSKDTFFSPRVNLPAPATMEGKLKYPKFGEIYPRVKKKSPFIMPTVYHKNAAYASIFLR